MRMRPCATDLERRHIPTERDARVGKDLRTAIVHAVLKLVHDLFHTRLHNFDRAPEAGAAGVSGAYVRIAVQDRALRAATVAPELEERIFLGVQAQALV